MGEHKDAERTLQPPAQNRAHPAAVPRRARPIAQMSKAKSKPKNAEPSRPATAGSRARDLEEDIFDVAHNTMLRSKVRATASLSASAFPTAPRPSP